MKVVPADLFCDFAFETCFLLAYLQVRQFLKRINFAIRQKRLFATQIFGIESKYNFLEYSIFLWSLKSQNQGADVIEGTGQGDH